MLLVEANNQVKLREDKDKKRYVIQWQRRLDWASPARFVWACRVCCIRAMFPPFVQLVCLTFPPQLLMCHANPGAGPQEEISVYLAMRE